MGFPLRRCCWRIPLKGGGRVKPGSPSEVSTCYAPSVAPPDGSESSCARDLTQFASSIFRVENSATNPDTLGGGMAERRTRRRFTREYKAQAVKRLPALNLILQLGERDLVHARKADRLSGCL